MPPDRARAVVIGGGVIGCSCLYHLARQGWTDSVLVEQFQLTHGSTWHSAGLVGQLRSSISLTRMMQYSVGLYAELKELTGNDPGWHQLGGLRLASSLPRVEEVRRQAPWGKTVGVALGGRPGAGPGGRRLSGCRWNSCRGKRPRLSPRRCRRTASSAPRSSPTTA